MNTLMIDPFDCMDNMFKQIDAMFSYPLTADNRLQAKGLKSIIHKPHNLITKKDENGVPVSYELEVVYTPFKKSDVKVNVTDGVLNVECGSENKVKDEDMDFCGISHQSYHFSLPLSESIETTQIEASAEDGILTIKMPIKKEIAKEKTPLAIEVK